MQITKKDYQNLLQNLARLRTDHDRLQADYQKLQAAYLGLQADNTALREQINKLTDKAAALSKNSSNSSKPPSSDVVKRTKASTLDKGKKRKIGGQPGHKGHNSELKREDAQQHVILESSHCPYCHSADIKNNPDKDQQFFQYELVEQPVVLTHYLSQGYCCCNCKKSHNAKTADNRENLGIAGPRLSSLTAFLKGSCHASYSVVQECLKDVFNTPLASGTIAKIIQRSTRALEQAYAELLQALPQERQLNIDETGFAEYAQRLWIWVFCALSYRVFKISASRSSAVLEEVLGKDYSGLIGSDYFGAYQKFMNTAPVRIQFCLAHLVRELKFLRDHGDQGAVRYANRLLTLLKETFKVYHNREKMGKREYAAKMRALRQEFLRFGTQSKAKAKGVGKLVKRLRKNGKSYFHFIEEGIEPTNNIAEQAIRYVVIDRKVTQGVRGANGRIWCERIWSIRASCRLQGRSVYAFLHASLSAMALGKKGPSLLTG